MTLVVSRSPIIAHRTHDARPQVLAVSCVPALLGGARTVLAMCGGSLPPRVSLRRLRIAFPGEMDRDVRRLARCLASKAPVISGMSRSSAQRRRAALATFEREDSRLESVLGSVSYLDQISFGDTLNCCGYHNCLVRYQGLLLIPDRSPLSGTNPFLLPPPPPPLPPPPPRVVFATIG